MSHVEDSTGYRLEPLTAALDPFRFRLVGPDGRDVQSLTLNHEKEVHLIVVRRDLTGYQHLHPSRDGDAWTASATDPGPGPYRVIADFRPAGRDGSIALGVDVPVPGPYQAAALPAPARTASTDGYTVTLNGGLDSGLEFSVARDGRPVEDLEPYLGAAGHLVALRQGDLTYVHVHAEESRLAFRAEVPGAGAYRLFLEFKHAGTVHTAEFTATAG
jgi:hypothetical protein